MLDVYSLMCWKTWWVLAAHSSIRFPGLMMIQGYVKGQAQVCFWSRMWMQKLRRHFFFAETTWKALLCNACGAVGWYPRTSQKGGGKSQIQVAKSLFVGSDWNWQPRSSFASLRAAGRVFRASATRKTDTRRLSTLLLTTTIACCRHPHGSGFAASQNPKP